MQKQAEKNENSLVNYLKYSLKPHSPYELIESLDHQNLNILLKNEFLKKEKLAFYQQLSKSKEKEIKEKEINKRISKRNQKSNYLIFINSQELE